MLRRPWLRAYGTVFLALCAAALWALSLQGVPLRQINDYGLVSVLPWSFFAALLVLTLSFCVAVHSKRARGALLLLHLVLLVLIIHGTPTILYDTARYIWAYKHVGIVDYIQRHHGVNAYVSYLNLYQDWPGFFALGALATDVAGVGSALRFANWAPVFFNLVDVGAVLFLAHTFTKERRLIWLSGWFYLLANWIGQDTFAPQALAYFLHLVIVGICLRWFAVTPLPALTPIARRRGLVFTPAVSLYYGIVGRTGPGETSSNRLSPHQRAAVMASVVLGFAAIVASHQLTPLMTIGALTALVLVQRCSARSLPLLMTAMTLAWFLYPGATFVQDNMHVLTGSFGRVVHNVSSNLHNLSQIPPGARFVTFVARGSIAVMWTLALLGALRRWRQGYWDVSVALLAIVPSFLLLGSPYGTEALLRVHLFALPYVAFFAAALLYPSAVCGTSRRTPLLALGVSGGLLFSLCVAYYGQERMNYFTQDELAASQYLHAVAPSGALMLEGSFNFPMLFRNYERYSYVSLDQMPRATRLKLIQDPVGFLGHWMRVTTHRAAYVIIARSQKAEAHLTGRMPDGALDRVQRALLRSARFTVIFANRDATIVTLNRRK